MAKHNFKYKAVGEAGLDVKLFKGNKRIDRKVIQNDMIKQDLLKQMNVI